jgi:hypothetical protein
MAPAGYTATAKFLHWLIVALVVAQFIVAWTMPHIGRNTPVVATGCCSECFPADRSFFVRTLHLVMPGPVPGLHVFLPLPKTWMASEVGLARLPQ